MIDIAAQIYVKQMSEADLKAAVAFFESPPGKQYVATQPAFLTDLVTAMHGWQGKISTRHDDPRARRNEEEGPRYLGVPVGVSKKMLRQRLSGLPATLDRTSGRAPAMRWRR